MQYDKTVQRCKCIRTYVDVVVVVGVVDVVVVVGVVDVVVVVGVVEVLKSVLNVSEIRDTTLWC